MENELKKSEILFLYETSYNIPNGDPFTGEQRYDEETKKILVSDVRIKRYVRTYLEEIKERPIYVSEKTGAGKTDSKGVLTWIAVNRNNKKLLDIAELLKEQIDVRLFGGISTLGDDAKKIKVDGKEMKNGHTQFTGPVQFALLNPSLNEVNLRMHQNTTHFTSRAENTQGSIGTTTLVPYSLIQIHGWVNPKVAEKTGMTEDDLKLMYEGLWYGTSGDGSSHSRSKVGQNSVLLLEIEYAQNNQKIYGVDRLIELKPKNNKKGEELRSMDDYELDFSKLIEKAQTDKVAKVKYYTEIEEIKALFKGNNKFEEITFVKDKAELK
ncbi:MAG: type I CRISPR-associated protein Cas7 [Paludibacter sp.]|nr:type I CRISPR-associated protein Cas7 [Paludibacter sp.]